MKSPGGHARRAATLVATALCGLAVTLWTPLAAHAQVAISHGPAVRDGTPDIDNSIAGKDWNGALRQLDARIASNPRDAQAKFKRATVLARLGRDQDAIAAFTEMTQTWPELPEPYNNLAALYAKEGRYEDARVALETAIKANPSYGLAYENLGDLYLRLADAAYRRAQQSGHTSGATAQRLADIEKIVSPPAATAPRPHAPVAASEAEQLSVPNIPASPSVQFGGPGGPLSAPPYMAPSR